VHSSQAETWNKYSSYYNPHVAQIINQTTQPLVIRARKGKSHNISVAMNLSQKRLLLVDGTKIPNIIDGFSDILFRSSEN